MIGEIRGRVRALDHYHVLTGMFGLQSVPFSVPKDPNLPPWREIYSVLHLGQRVLGIAYLSAHVSDRWSFGNYLGVLDGFRYNSRAQWFVRALLQRVKEIDHQSRGILFEVDPLNLDCLRQALRQGAIAGTAEESDVIENLRSLRRLVLYQRKLGAYAILGADDQPLPYWQPALSETLDASDERPLILMFLPDGDQAMRQFDAIDAIRFIYDKLYRDAYGGTSSAEIDGLADHVESVWKRVEMQATRTRLGKVKIDRGLYLGLTTLAQREGIGSRLNL